MVRFMSDKLKIADETAEFFKEWIRVPHWKTCWEIGYCENCHKECIEYGIKYELEPPEIMKSAVKDSD